MNVTFELLPIHGDCDLYVSTTELFPNKTDYDKRSMRVGSNEDLVKYSLTD